MNAEKRGMELLSVKRSNLPSLALGYLEYLSSKIGLCIEVCLTAYTHYAQAIEDLKSEDVAYKITKDGLLWFENNK